MRAGNSIALLVSARLAVACPPSPSLFSPPLLAVAGELERRHHSLARCLRVGAARCRIAAPRAPGIHAQSWSWARKVSVFFFASGMLSRRQFGERGEEWSFNHPGITTSVFLSLPLSLSALSALSLSSLLRLSPIAGVSIFFYATGMLTRFIGSLHVAGKRERGL